MIFYKEILSLKDEEMKIFQEETVPRLQVLRRCLNFTGFGNREMAMGNHLCWTGNRRAGSKGSGLRRNGRWKQG